MQTHEQDLIELVQEYEEIHGRAENFVHVQKKHSSNRDFQALYELTKAENFYTVNLKID